MATQADIELVRKALNGLSDRAKVDLVEMWSAIDHTDYRQVRRLVAQSWPMLVGKYGEIAAALAADMFRLQAEVLGIKARLEVADGVNPDRANARANWALTQPDQFGNLVVLLDELVKQPYRSTFQDSAVKSGAAWARVPSGSEACAFCLMLASRGAVYHTKQTAGGRGKKFHGGCGCAVVLVRDERDYPPGYDPDGLYQDYLNARAASASDSTSSILSEMRDQLGTN